MLERDLLKPVTRTSGAMRVIDSHTAGEPTRLIIEGGPDLGSGSLAERRDRFSREFDHIRSFTVNEPRGSDALVGALLCEPVDPTCAAGLIFFNNVGFLGMCGHGTIGAAVTLHRMGQLELGVHRFETPVGIVTVELTGPNEATIENVPSFRLAADVAVEAQGYGTVTGDIAWGGNWFFLTEDTSLPLSLDNLGALTARAEAIRRGLTTAGITGSDGGEIDHVEIFGAPAQPGSHSRNFVLCPGSAYDRSPCGTGTSAKLACLAAAGKLAPGVDWVQESVLGTRFTARYRLDVEGWVIPTITGRAYVTAEAVLLRDAEDSFADGVRA